MFNDRILYEILCHHENKQSKSDIPTEGMVIPKTKNFV